MNGNTFGKAFSVTTFGESHGVAIGVVIDGCLPGITFDEDLLRKDLQRRKPGQSTISSPRAEMEEYEVLSGVFEGKTLGTPIAIVVRNTNVQSKDYDALKDIFRPSHADYTYQAKYGIRDHRGGGRQSARETVARVIAGAVAKMILNGFGVNIKAYVSQIHEHVLTLPYQSLKLEAAENNEVRCPDETLAEKMKQAILKAKEEGDSLGGTISCVITGAPAGWGEPVFDKLHADLAKAMMSINAVKGFEIGSGFAAASMKGSQHNDAFTFENEKVKTLSNFSGGVQGGITNGEDIFFKVAFKPVASIRMEQDSIDTSHQSVKIKVEGRHDSCVVPRAVPIVEAMAAMVLVDHYLRQNSRNMQPFA